jgi:uncharacterized membrane protein YjfL (UPF0719 family)
MTFFGLVTLVWSGIAVVVALIVFAIVWSYKRNSRRLRAVEEKTAHLK